MWTCGRRRTSTPSRAVFMTSRRSQITLQPDVLRWARERARISAPELANKMNIKLQRIVEWESHGKISIAQVDKLAERTHTPLGFLYLSEPPEDRLPIKDFRTRSDDDSRPPSPDLLETVYAMQRRQAWMREDLIATGAEPLEFVGAYSLNHNHTKVASAMREALGLADGWAGDVSNWSQALRSFRESLETIGVLVTLNGVVGNDNTRTLDPDEFQGFALVDEYAPLIFVNNADFIVAKMFTLAHEMAHLCIGESGVSLFDKLQPPSDATEKFCDQVAAEFLVPEAELLSLWPRAKRAPHPYEFIAKQFKVSAVVAARRALDLGLIKRPKFFAFYEEEQQREARIPPPEGGSFWNNQRMRMGQHFASAVLRAAKEGRLSYTEAYSLTGLRGKAFDSLPAEMGIRF